MEWFKLYANTAQRIAVRRLSAPAFRLLIEGRCYIASVETDGLIPTEQLPLFGPCGKQKYADELVLGLLWLSDSDGWIDTAWSQEQDSIEKIMRRRRATADRVARHAENLRNAVTDGAANAATNGVSNASRVEKKERGEKKEETDACDHGASRPGLCALCRVGATA